MQDTDRSQPPQAAAAPDDVRNYHASVVFGTIANALKSGWNHVALFRQSLRVGAAGRLAALDGLDGLVIADGATSGFAFGDRVSGTNYGLWWRSGTSLNLNSADGGALWAINALTGVVTSPAGTAVTFANSWANFGAPYAAAKYKKYLDGTVQLRGVVKGGAASTIACTLPAGFRPTERVPITTEYFNGSVFGAGAGGYIDTTGDLLLVDNGAAAGAFVAFNLRFDTTA